jgi:glycosyltransferase involved in cell wall biosynthesis
MRTIQLLRKLDPAEWGGTEMALQRLFGELRKDGVAPVVYCPKLTNDHSKLEDPLVRDGYQVNRFSAFVPILGISEERRRQMVAVGGNLMSLDLLASLWREKDVALVHSHTLGRIGGIAQAIARQRKVPFVLTIHGGVFDLPENVRKTFNAPIQRGWEWGKLFGLIFRSHQLLQKADAILTCNPREAMLVRERFPNQRVVVQPHGLDPAPYLPDYRAAARAAFPRLIGKTVLLCLGRVDPVKNQAWLLDQAPTIFARHANAILLLAGPCTDEPYGKLIGDKIAHLGLSERVLLTGPLSPGDPRLLGLLQEARTLIVPSLSETFGLVILESWAAGTMVLASRTSGASALIESGRNGWLFDLAQPDTFHEALGRTLANPETCAEMVRLGQEKLRNEYTLSATAGALKNLYDELIAEKRIALRPESDCANVHSNRRSTGLHHVSRDSRPA